MTTISIQLRLADSWVKSDEALDRTARDFRKLFLSLIEKKGRNFRILEDNCTDTSLRLEMQCMVLTFSDCRRLVDQAALQMGYLSGSGDELQRESRRLMSYRVEEKKTEPAAQPEDKRPEILKEIDDLIGAQEFKAFAHEIVQMRSLVSEAGAEDVLYSQRPLLAIGHGCGLDRSLGLLRRLLYSCGLPIEDEECPIVVLEAPVDSQDNEPLRTALIKLKKLQDCACLTCVDLSKWVSLTGDARFTEFLRRCASDLFDSYVVFRVPYLDQQTLRRVESDFSSLCFVRRIEFPPLTGEEMTEAAARILAERKLSMDSSAVALFSQRIMKEKSSGGFSGFMTIQRVVNEMIYLKLRALSEGKSASAEVITGEDLSLFREDIELDMTGEQILENMVGLTSLKAELNEILEGITVDRRFRGKQSGLPYSLHMCFKGNPGTGKTSAARAVARILHERGVLSVGNLYEINARELCGTSIGETAPKTTDICRSAYGSVLFIDEAYSLYNGDENSRDFGREALNTLVTEMENNRSQLVVILAGYSDDMEKLFKGNSGLRSRISRTLEFPNYSADELCEIFRRMVKPPFTCGDEFTDRLREYFEKIPYTAGKQQSDSLAREFGNGRHVRNLYERLQAKASTRYKLSGGEGDVIELLPVDLEIILEDDDFSRFVSAAPSRQIGFH